MRGHTIKQDLTRDALLEQETQRIRDKIEHYASRIARGTADDEDRAAERLYARILAALLGMA